MRAIGRGVLIAGVVAVIQGGFTSGSMADPTETSCTAPRIRSPGVEEIVEDEIRYLGRGQGVEVHVQDLGEGRPIPELNIMEYKRAWTKSKLPWSRWRELGALYYAIHDQRRRSSDPEALNLPFDVYWCLAARGDWVLLSDERTSHWTTIAAIDRERGTVDLLDRWPRILATLSSIAPEKIVAKSGRLSGKVLMRVTSADLKLVFRGAITLDTSDFRRVLEQLLPSEAWTPELYLAIGRSLLYAGSDNLAFARDAAVPLLDGVKAAGQAGKQEIVELSLPAVFTALQLAGVYHATQGNQAALETADRVINEMIGIYGSTPIERLSAEDALRIATAASAMGNREWADLYFAEAIRKDPEDWRAFLRRSMMMHRELLTTLEASHINSPDTVRGAQEDIDAALERMAARAREFARRRSEGQQHRGVYWEKGVTARDVDQAELENMKADRIVALTLRGAYRMFVNDFAGASADGLELIASAPENRNGYEIAGEAEILLGHEASGRALLERAEALRPEEMLWRIGGAEARRP